MRTHFQKPNFVSERVLKGPQRTPSRWISKKAVTHPFTEFVLASNLPRFSLKYFFLASVSNENHWFLRHEMKNKNFTRLGSSFQMKQPVVPASKTNFWNPVITAFSSRSLVEDPSVFAIHVRAQTFSVALEKHCVLLVKLRKKIYQLNLSLLV